MPSKRGKAKRAGTSASPGTERTAAAGARPRPPAGKRAATPGAPLPGAPNAPARATRRAAVDVMHADAALFAPLTEGERADALRTLLEDERLRGLAKLGRYRVVAAEPLSVKPPDALAGRRLARLSLYDYAGDRAVEASVDLDRGAVCHVSTSAAQPALSADEEADARHIAAADERVRARLADGHGATAVMHYWSLRVLDFAFRRRSAAVLFGAPGQRPSLVAVVSLVDRQVVDVVDAGQW
jgi:hypothetical protein